MNLPSLPLAPIDLLLIYSSIFFLSRTTGKIMIAIDLRLLSLGFHWSNLISATKIQHLYFRSSWNLISAFWVLQVNCDAWAQCLSYAVAGHAFSYQLWADSELKYTCIKTEQALCWIAHAQSASWTLHHKCRLSYKPHLSNPSLHRELV